jgi:PAS domain S-box-containing protein
MFKSCGGKEVYFFLNIQAKDAVKLNPQHNQALAELANYRLLVESIQDYAIFILDKGGHVRTWNKGAEKNKGYLANEIIGKHFSIFYLEDDVISRKPERELELAQKLGRVEDEGWRVRKDGSQFWASVVITALYNTSGTLVGYGKITRDLTERKSHEDELRKANYLLREQQKDLEELNLSKDEFISLASHQLRTPATVIKQYIGMLLEGFKGRVSGEQTEILQKAYDSNERQILIVNDLLRVAQVDAGKVIIHKVPMDIKSLLTDMVEGQRSAFGKRGQTVITKFDEPISDINLDPVHFRMALENILDNAIKYTPNHGKIMLSVSAAPKSSRVKISIEDTGVGLKQKDIPKLFTKFARISNSLSSKVGGSGLGLYWADKIVKLHGGTIEVDSKLNKGTNFNIWVPVS